MKCGTESKLSSILMGIISLQMRKLRVFLIVFLSFNVLSDFYLHLCVFYYPLLPNNMQFQGSFAFCQSSRGRIETGASAITPITLEFSDLTTRLKCIRWCSECERNYGVMDAASLLHFIKTQYLDFVLLNNTWRNPSH